MKLYFLCGLNGTDGTLFVKRWYEWKSWTEKRKERVYVVFVRGGTKGWKPVTREEKKQAILRVYLFIYLFI